MVGRRTLLGSAAGAALTLFGCSSTGTRPGTGASSAPTTASSTPWDEPGRIQEVLAQLHRKAGGGDRYRVLIDNMRLRVTYADRELTWKPDGSIRHDKKPINRDQGPSPSTLRPCR